MHETLRKHANKLFGREESFTRNSLCSLGNGINPALAEKSVHALEYVAQLACREASFVFTGGTAAQVLLAEGISRLSKDVDVIALEGGRDDWRKIVQQIAEHFDGEVYEATEEERQHGGLNIPAIHFLVRYPTAFPSGTTPDIELDVVFGQVSFPTQDTQLASRFFSSKKAIAVRTPTIEGLFGGKLSALGPGTIGIPRGKANFDVAVGKQLFDLGHLLPRVEKLNDVAQSYHAAYERQVSYHSQNLRPSIEETLRDAMYTLKLLAAPPGAKGPNAEWPQDLGKLSQAAIKLRGYVGDNEGFDRVYVRNATSRISLVVALVQRMLVLGMSAEEAQARWENYVERIRADVRNQDAITAAMARFREIPWEERPHINIKEFTQAVGPEALLYWDATFQEMKAT